MLDRIRHSLARHVRRSLISGVLLLLPVALTYVIIRFLFDLADGVLRPWIEWCLGQFGIEWTLPGPGVVAAVVIVYLVGALATFGLGRMAVDWARSSLLRVPFVGTVYSANRQLVESFSGTSTTGFKRVVLVQFPRAGAWSLGFLTGITDADGVERLIMTYVPTAPLPNSGFVVLMPPQDVLDTDLSVPDAMQLMFSGGIVSPSTIKTRKIDLEEVERQIRQTDLPANAIAEAVGRSVSAVASRATKLSVKRLRRSAAKAVRAATPGVHEPGPVARDAMMGAMHAVDVVGGRSVDQVRDATIGVVLGVRDAAGMTTRTLHDAVAGAILGGKGRDVENATVQGAAEGTMQVAASVGLPIDQAVTQISRATMASLEESDMDLIEGGKATMRGVISGAVAVREDVLSAARHCAYELVFNGAQAGLTDLDSLCAALGEVAAETGADLSLETRALANAVAEGVGQALDGLRPAVATGSEEAVPGTDD